MTNDNVKVYEALRIINQAFPSAEIMKPNGLREKLSFFIGLASDVKPRQAVSRQSKKTYSQTSFDFCDSFVDKQGGTK
jgi:hypothetical protein